MRRLQQAETILGLVAEVRAKLESELVGWARANLDDMRAQLDALAHPGFLREAPAAERPNIRAGSRRCPCAPSALQRDPLKDQARMLEVKPFLDALAVADPADPRPARVAPGTGRAARAIVRAGTRREGRGVGEEAGAARAATAPGAVIT